MHSKNAVSQFFHLFLLKSIVLNFSFMDLGFILNKLLLYSVKLRLEALLLLINILFYKGIKLTFLSLCQHPCCWIFLFFCFPLLFGWRCFRPGRLIGSNRRVTCSRVFLQFPDFADCNTCLSFCFQFHVEAFVNRWRWSWLNRFSLFVFDI